MNKVTVRIVVALCAAAGFLSATAGDGAGVDGAKWIGLPPDGTNWTGVATNQPPLPKNTIRLRKTFSLKAGVIASARVVSSGLGFSEVWVNGAKIDPDRMLAPCVCNYNWRILTVAQDATAHVKAGRENTGGPWVSPGYSDDFSKYGWRWLWPKRAILRLDVKFADGTTQTVTTDETWEWTDETPIPTVSVYNGETYDATRADPAWCLPSGSRARWRPVAVLPPPRTNHLELHTGPAVRTFETFRAVEIRETDPGVYTVDFGQNLAGVCEIRAKGPKGTRIELRHAETVATNGTGWLDPFTIRKAKQLDTFILAGTGAHERFRPRFTYHGFRYVEVRGYPGRLMAEDIAMRAVHADVRYTAGFTSSDPTLNWIFNAAKWTLLSNLLSYPSDCCDRDERTPCRGDSMKAEVSSMRFFDMRTFYRKWLEDTRFDRTGIPITTGDLVMLPWRMWMWYGDRVPIEERYDNMKDVVLRHFLKLYPSYIVEKNGYGDWCHPNNKTWADYFCEPRAVESAALIKLLMTMRATAETLGKKEDEAMWAVHVEKAKKAYNAEFYNPATHVYASGIQVNYLLPLAFGIVPESERAAVTAKLLETIRQKDGGKLTTGGTGTRHLVEVLCDAGEADLAFHVLTQPEYPSPAYMRSRGATTMWEQWYYERAMNAHAHMMFTGLGSTLFTCFAGIRPVKPGYAEIEIRPSCPAKLDFVDAWMETPRGKVSVAWKREGGKIRFRIVVPADTPATLRLPDGSHRPLAAGVNEIVSPKPQNAD